MPVETVIAHARLSTRADVTESYFSDTQTNTVVCKIDSEIPEDYHKTQEELVRLIYLDKEYFGFVTGSIANVRLQVKSTIHIIDVFTVSHESVRFLLDGISPGNKARIVYKAKSGDFFDVEKHRVFYDGGAGGDIDEYVGEFDTDADGGGPVIKTVKKFTKKEFRELFPK